MLKSRSFTQEKVVDQSHGQSSSVPLLLAVLSKSSDSQLWDALSIYKSKNNMHKHRRLN